MDQHETRTREQAEVEARLAATLTEKTTRQFQRARARKDLAGLLTLCVQALEVAQEIIVSDQEEVAEVGEVAGFVLLGWPEDPHTDGTVDWRLNWTLDPAGEWVIEMDDEAGGPENVAFHDLPATLEGMLEAFDLEDVTTELRRKAFGDEDHEVLVLPMALCRKMTGNAMAALELPEPTWV